MAGGLADSHGSNAYVIREIKSKKDVTRRPRDGQMSQVSIARTARQEEETPDYDFMTVNITGMLRGQPVTNMFLEPGDIVNIPPAGRLLRRRRGQRARLVPVERRDYAAAGDIARARDYL